MMVRKKGQLLTMLSIAVFLVTLLGWSISGFVRANQASDELPRLFLQLERAIGYDGFIHNFKNFVLRPNEPRYLDSALEDFRLAEKLLEDIRALAERLEISTNLAPVEITLRAYRDMLDTILDARTQGLGIAELDTRIRVSDAAASSSIHQFQMEIEAVLETRQRSFSALLIVTMLTVFLAVSTLFYLQYQKRRIAEKLSADLAEKSAFIMQAEQFARIGQWKITPGGHMQLSKAAMNICGIEQDDFSASPDFFSSVVPKSDAEKLQLAMTQASNQTGHFVCLHRLTKPDGSVISVVNSGETVVNTADGSVGFVGMLQDVTQLTDAEDKLRQSQKMESIGNLAGGIAHDFNNNLAVILGNLELLKEVIADGQQERYVRNALDAAQNGADLTRNMLSFARQSPLNPELIQINDMVREVVNWSERLLPSNIQVETSLLANLWEIDADSSLAQNALLNLILNARDAMEDGGALTIETANVRIDESYIESRDEDLVPGRYVMLAVSDQGCGIDDDTLERVFEPFFSTKAPGEGSGLGLSMVLGFMKQSGGTVRVYSEPNVGTTFKLYFKVGGSELAKTAQAKSGTRTPGYAGSRVLLAEDNKELLKTLEELLTLEGYEVTTANSGDEAYAAWTNDPTFDVIVTDIVMPGTLQGTHLAREVREHTLEAPPFIFMSGYPNEAAVNGNGLHPEDIRLMKPVNRSDLVAAIERALSGRSQA